MSERGPVGSPRLSLSLSLSSMAAQIRESIHPSLYSVSNSTTGYFVALAPLHLVCYPPGTYRISFKMSTRKLEDDPPNGWGVSSTCE